MEFFLKLLQCFFCWEVKSDAADVMCEADVIIALSFGASHEDPNKSNVALARNVTVLRTVCNLPIIVQWEIGNYLSSSFHTDFLSIYKHREEGKYLDTYEVLAQAFEACRDHDLEKVIVVAHPDHVWRAIMTARKMGFDVVVPPISDIPYDQESTQPWTRSRTRFMVREIPARIIYLFKGWI
ncbi:hypothetical protein IIA95_02695 [Patescibacteria group bacterium]|nr:hypothetical protein [Patescibacteria group bacterium]